MNNGLKRQRAYLSKSLKTDLQRADGVGFSCLNPPLAAGAFPEGEIKNIFPPFLTRTSIPETGYDNRQYELLPKNYLLDW
jgi:hypothetical protein